MRIHYAMGALDKSIRLRAAAAKNPAPKSNPPKLGAAASRHAREYATMLIDRFDTNRDGKLTREEARKAAWQNAESTWFMEDANNDDRVSWQELHDAFARLARKFQSTNSRPPYVSSKNAWQKCDTNRDGQVDRKEARNSVEHPAAEQFFFRGDLDGNDRLTLNELNIHFGFVAHQKWASVRQSLATKTKISQVRAVETMIIEKFDTNRDGALTLNEIKKLAQNTDLKVCLVEKKIGKIHESMLVMCEAMVETKQQATTAAENAKTAAETGKRALDKATENSNKLTENSKKLTENSNKLTNMENLLYLVAEQSGVDPEKMKELGITSTQPEKADGGERKNASGDDATK